MPDGDVADFAVVVAARDAGSRLALVDLKGAGVKRERRRPSIRPARTRASRSTAPPAELLGAEGKGWELPSSLLDRAAVLIAFEQLGGAEGCLEMARDYALGRYAFGRPIGSFQAIKHKLADIVHRERAGALELLLRRVGAVRPTPTELPVAAARRAHRATRGLLLRVEGEHPDPRRHRLHLGVRLPPLLSPREAAVAVRSAARGSWKDRLISAARTQQRAGRGLRRNDQMDFNDTPKKPRTAQVRAWLEANAQARGRARASVAARGRAKARLRCSAPRSGRPRSRRRLRRASPGRRSTAAAARSPIQQVIFDQEEASYDVPPGIFDIGLGMCGPTIDAPTARRTRSDRYAAEMLARRGDLVPALLRAGRRLRPRRPAHHAVNATATTGSSTARRSGPPARTTATGASWSPAPIPTCPSTRASPSSSST